MTTSKAHGRRAGEAHREEMAFEMGDFNLHHLLTLLEGTKKKPTKK